MPFPLSAPSWPSAVPRPAPERRTGLEYDHEWSRRYPVRLARAVVLDDVARPLARVLAPTTVRGGEHLHLLDPPVIFAVNHTSHVDTPLLLSVLPVSMRHRTVVAAAADYFFDRTWKANLWAFALAAVPIERSRVNRRSADTAAELLEDGWNLIIFPEGGRSPDGWQQEFRGGAAYLARRTGRPVVPVHLAGTRRVLGKRPETGPRPQDAPGGSGTEARGTGRLRRAPVTVTFGSPLYAEEGEDARRLGRRIAEAVAVLAEESRTDWWTARRRAASGTAHDPRGPEASPWRRAWLLSAAEGTPNGSERTDLTDSTDRTERTVRPSARSWTTQSRRYSRRRRVGSR